MKTQNDILDVAPKGKQFPKCDFRMKQKVRLTQKGFSAWIERERKAHEKVLRRMKREGYKGVSFEYFWIQNKHDVTSPITVVEPNRTGEIVGINCNYGLPLQMVCNECYLNQGSSHSGITYYYDVLFRKTDDNGRKICYIAKGFSRFDFE